MIALFSSAAPRQAAAGVRFQRCTDLVVKAMGPGTLLGPGCFGIDMAVARLFKVRETPSVEIRGEAFNVLNRVNPLNPMNTLTSSTFGQILMANDPRILQFSLKLLF
jgi:hypothetical protein